MRFTKAEDERLHVCILYTSPLGYDVPDGYGSMNFIPLDDIKFVQTIEAIYSSIKETSLSVDNEFFGQNSSGRPPARRATS